ncbi:unnamed protein product, partial [Symbiodinium necroappetens]
MQTCNPGTRPEHPARSEFLERHRNPYGLTVWGNSSIGSVNGFSNRNFQASKLPANWASSRSRRHICTVVPVLFWKPDAQLRVQILVLLYLCHAVTTTAAGSTVGVLTWTYHWHNFLPEFFLQDVQLQLY